MKQIQALTDKAAISLSLLCTIHCLVLPFVTLMLPSLTFGFFGEESFHIWMLVAVIPTSIIALSMGCRKHKGYQLLLIGGLGLTFLIAGAFVGHDLGEIWEKAFTVIGAALIAIGHIWNYRLCQHAQKTEGECCACTEADIESSKL